VKSFSQEVHTDKPKISVLTELITTTTNPLGRWGYEVRGQTENALTFTRTYRPWYVWLLAIILFPIGLLALLGKETATIAITLEPNENGTLVRITGQGPAEVERAFQTMQI
jgi:hypothetical protein